jgi:hypothetical protein
MSRSGRETTTRERRFESRAGSRLLVGALVGALLGVVVGLAAAALFDGSPRALLAAGIAGALFGGGVGAFASGISSLESPRPGREPSESPGVDPNPPRDAEGRSDDLVVDERPPPTPRH